MDYEGEYPKEQLRDPDTHIQREQNQYRHFLRKYCLKSYRLCRGQAEAPFQRVWRMLAKVADLACGKACRPDR